MATEPTANARFKIQDSTFKIIQDLRFKIHHAGSFVATARFLCRGLYSWGFYTQGFTGFCERPSILNLESGISHWMILNFESYIHSLDSKLSTLD